MQRLRRRTAVTHAVTIYTHHIIVFVENHGCVHALGLSELASITISCDISTIIFINLSAIYT